jgi:glycerol-1-phosphate dehydrogenase [NAD(P)+]
MKQFDFSARLDGCACGSVHECGVHKVIIENGALSAIPQMLGEHKNVVLVCDLNTWDACGGRVADLLAASGFIVRTMRYPQNEILVPDDDAVNALLKSADEQTQAIIGVGTGVINDLCKWASFCLKLPYMIVATAPSMDGFASTGAALIIKGMKVTYEAHVPRWIVADTDVLKRAPLTMIRAGAGDILGKISSLNDWKISHIINGEMLCQQVYDMVEQQIAICRQDLPAINRQDEHAIARLMEALVAIGFCMSYVGNSRPASGSEHHLSHFFEVIGLLNKQPYFPHGIDVAYSTAVTCALRHRLVHDIQRADYGPMNQEKWQERVQAVYGTLAPKIIALQNRVGFYGDGREERQARIRKLWPQLQSVLTEVPEEKEMAALLEELGLHMPDFVEEYGKSKIEQSIIFAKELKDRYTLLWLMQDIGLLEEFAGSFIQELC